MVPPRHVMVNADILLQLLVSLPCSLMFLGPRPLKSLSSTSNGSSFYSFLCSNPLPIALLYLDKDVEEFLCLSFLFFLSSLSAPKELEAGWFGESGKQMWIYSFRFDEKYLYSPPALMTYKDFRTRMMLERLGSFPFHHVLLYTFWSSFLSPV